jgi:DNA polymerase III subunit delta'
MLFSQVIGQDRPKEKLRSMLGNNRLPHALLFSGQEGSGALPLALAFSQYVLCEKTASGQGNVDSCGVCASCVKAAKLVHPDIHYSFPVITPEKSSEKPVSASFITPWREFVAAFPYGNSFDWLQFINAGNKQGNITAAECTDISHKLSLKSFEGGYKILLMWLPEYLGREGNKLLKLIEEPPEDTLFLLVTENEAQILPTILSRVQTLRLPLPEIEELEQALRDRAGLVPEKARQIAAISQQNYRQALSQLQDDSGDWQGLLREWLNAILKSGPLAQVKWIEDISKSGRERQKQFLQYFIHLLEQAVRLRMAGENPTRMPEGERDFALRLNKIADTACQEAIMQELDRAVYYIERNAHAKMLFHALTIRFYHLLSRREVAVMQ